MADDVSIDIGASGSRGSYDRAGAWPPVAQGVGLTNLRPVSGGPRDHFSRRARLHPVRRPGVRALRRALVVRRRSSRDDQPPIIFDLGTGLRRYGISCERRVPRHGACSSHLHWDHMQGLPFFMPLHEEGATLDIYGPRQAEGSLGEVFAQMMRPPFFPIRPSRPRRRRSLPRHRRRRLPGRAREGALALGPPRRADARFPRRVERRVGRVPPRPRPGLRSSSDADDYVPHGVLELCDGVDLLIHDAQHTTAEYEPKRHWGHCTVDYALHVAARVRRRSSSCCSTTTRCTATTRWIASRTTRASSAARMGGPEVTVARDGLELQLRRTRPSTAPGRAMSPSAPRRSRPTPRPTERCSVTSRPASCSSPRSTATSPSGWRATRSRRCRSNRRSCCSARRSRRRRGRASKLRGKWAANILDEDGEEVCRLFAQKGADRFAHMAYTPGRSGSPILEDALAFVDCETIAEHDAGDHVIVVGRVARARLSARRQAVALLPRRVRPVRDLIRGES